jgi:LemA protein
MKTWMKVLLGLGAAFIILVIVLVNTFVGVHNEIIAKEELVKEKWSQVENVYQRRADLIPNLVNTVKGYADHENQTLTEVTQARARLGGTVKLGADALRDPQAMAKFQNAQTGLGSALQRLMMVSERYPDLKANQNFSNLQIQLEGTENRIAVERKRYNEAVRNFNTFIRQFPNSIIAGFQQVKTFEPFEAAAGAAEAPQVEF